MQGVFSGKLIKHTGSIDREVQYGPLVIPKQLDPIDKVISGTIGSFSYERNGLVDLDPNKVEFLGS